MTFTTSDIATFFLLIGLELVLGIDNILVISIVTGRLPAHEQKKARVLGLGLAFLLRVVFVLGASTLTKLTAPVIDRFSWRDLILLFGGGFLLVKAVKEIHHVVESPRLMKKSGNMPKASTSFTSAVIQLLALDAIFSIDSVITAVGLTDFVIVIIGAVLISFAIVLLFSAKVSQFIEENPALKILALSFLITIGVTLSIEGMGFHVPKAYIYLPMGFALFVEFLQMRYEILKKRVSNDQA